MEFFTELTEQGIAIGWEAKPDGHPSEDTMFDRDVCWVSADRLVEQKESEFVLARPIETLPKIPRVGVTAPELQEMLGAI
jgi:hypothetical protein